METKRIEVYDRDKREVVLDLGEGNHLVFDPQLAVQVAQSLIQAATGCGYEVSVAIPKAKVTQALRNRLVVRLNVVLQSMRGRKDIHVAATLTDIVLSEVC